MQKSQITALCSSPYMCGDFITPPTWPVFNHPNESCPVTPQDGQSFTSQLQS